jgi:hypothetical protein
MDGTCLWEKERERERDRERERERDELSGGMNSKRNRASIWQTGKLIGGLPTTTTQGTKWR